MPGGQTELPCNIAHSVFMNDRNCTLFSLLYIHTTVVSVSISVLILSSCSFLIRAFLASRDDDYRDSLQCMSANRPVRSRSTVSVQCFSDSYTINQMSSLRQNTNRKKAIRVACLHCAITFTPVCWPRIRTFYYKVQRDSLNCKCSWDVFWMCRVLGSHESSSSYGGNNSSAYVRKYWNVPASHKHLTEYVSVERFNF